ncbi:MAG: PKD domain-containing protein [Saprospiraceae bacterium]
MQFTNSYTGNNIVFEKWTFGDGNSSVDVSSPLHTFLFYCFPPYAPRTYLVTHQVTVLENEVPVTYTCTEEVTVNCDGTSNCTDRYFNFEIIGCTVAFNSSFDDPNVFITWNFGDGSPLQNGYAVAHSYAQPGTYLVTQDYVAFGVPGSCSRWVTVGCCCEAISNFTANLTLDCATLLLDAYTWCEQQGRYSTWELQIGNETIQLNDGFEIDCDHEQITNYSTYTDGPPVLRHRVFCEGEEVIVSQELTPPVDGIFIGKANPCGGGGCLPPTTNMTDYDDVLPGAAINGSQINYDVYVSGMIIVDKSFSFTNGINIFMGQATGFDVPGGRTLEFARGVNVVGTCCLWRGIYVYGSGTFRSQCGSDPVLTNLIADALYAVRPFNSGGGQPRIALRQTIFENNLIGLRATDGAFILHGSAGTFPYFERNQFVSGNLMCIGCLTEIEDILPSLGLTYSIDRALAGMWLEGNNGPNSLTNLTIFPSNEGWHNTFDNLAIGIEARNFNFNMKDCATFRNITNSSPYGFGRGINYRDVTGNFSLDVQGLVTNGTNQWNANAFNNCTVGIRAEGREVNPTTVNIDDCRMVNMQTGIYLDGFFGNIEGRTRHNNIEASSLGIGLFDAFANGARQYQIDNNVHTTGPLGRSIAMYGTGLSNTAFVEVDHNQVDDAGALGILANTHRNVYIHDNDITVNGSFGGIVGLNGQYEIECNKVSGAADFGIQLWNAPIRNDLSFNTVDGVSEGMRFELDCPGQNFIECNTVQNTTGLGLHYVDARTDGQFNTGNSWTNTAGATFVPGMYFPIQSQYDVPNLAPWFPIPLNPALGWFNLNALLTPPACEQACQPGLLPPGGGEENPFDTDIAGGNLPGEDYDHWRRERYLLYKLAPYPELAPTGSTMESFQNTKATTTVGRMVAIGLQLMALFEIPVAEQSTLTTNEAQMLAKSAQIAAIDQTLSEELTPAEYEALISQRETLNTEIAALLAQSNSILAQLQMARNAQADVLLTQLSAIAALAVHEQNEKEVLGIYLQSIAQGHAPDVTQLSTLKSIGEQCPREGGPAAVYMAANLYEGISGETIEQDDCGTEARNQRDQMQMPVSGSFHVRAFPNPTGGLLQVAIERGQAPYTIRAIDLLGREVARQELIAAENPTIDTKSFTSGVYRLQVLDASGTQATRTFIVKH